MIPAKISSLNPVQVEYYTGLEPIDKFLCPEENKTLSLMWDRYNSSKFIADVENVEDERYIILRWIDVENKEIQIETCRLDINQPVFIELTGEGKAKIVKL